MQQRLLRHTARSLATLTALLLMLQGSYAQVPTFQDCLGATPICLGTFTNGNIITGTGNYPNEINPATSCLLTGERNDAWYIITTGSSGNLGFSIVPNNPAHNYDWAVYNLTSAVCADIFSTPSLEVACNYSNTPGTTGPNGLTGAQNGSLIPVSAGQTYLINVSGFSGINQSGYTIDFSTSTTTVVDNTKPQIGSITAMNCGATSMVISFTERVLCSSVQPSDFTITGPGGPYTVSAVSSTACTAGATYSRDYNLTFSPAITASGTYTVTLAGAVTDLCSNNATVPQNFQVPISGVNINIQKTDVTCFGGNNGSATAQVSGAPGPYTYQWSPSGGSGATAQFLTAGTYTVTVTSAMGCSATSTFTISQPLTGMTASATVSPANGCAANGSATVTVSNGQPPYTYSWWPSGGNAATATGLTAGGYMVTITDANQCALNYFLNIPSASGPSIAIGNVNPVSCFGGNDGSATVTVSNATGPFIYNWQPSGGSSATASGLTAGNYTVEVIVAQGCTLTAGVTIVEPPTPVSVNVSSVNTSCGNNNGSISVAASGGTGGFSYQWSPNVSSGTSASSLAAGSYTITVTDGNGCSVSNNVNIAPSTQPALSLTNQQHVSCFGLSDGSTGVIINGGAAPYTVNWSSGQSSTILNNIPAGTYTVTVTDAQGCQATATDIVTQPSLLSASLVNVQHVLCFGDSTGSATVSFTGGGSGHQWTWTGTSSTGAAASNLTAGNYSATVTDLNGCSASVNITVNGPASALSVQGTITPTSCGNSDGSITTQTAGGTLPYTYSWSNGATGTSLSLISAGIFTITVTDNNGCTIDETFAVQASNAPSAVVHTISHVSCNGGSDGSASVNVSGGVLPYTFNWQGGVGSGSSASGLAAGNHAVTVTDAAGCAAVLQFVITEPDPVQVSMPTLQPLCIGQSTNAGVSATGGTAPYAFVWSNGATGSQQTFGPVATTTYTLTVTDANGCPAPAQSLTVTVNDPLTAGLVFPDSVCKGSDAPVTVTASGGDGNFQFAWSNGLTGPSNLINVNSDINLTVTVTDGCSTPSTQVSVAITAVSAPGISFDLDDQTGCIPFEAVFDVPAGLPSGMTYLWNFGNGFFSAQPSTSHIYTDPGTYHVSLALAYQSAPGCSTVLQFPNSVRALDVPVSRFIFDPQAPTRSKPEVYFTDRSTGASRWSWQFGDGNYSSLQNPRHVYADTGSFTVKLLVQTFEGCSDSTQNLVTVKDDIEIFIPNAFTPDGSGVNDYFQVYGVGIISYQMEIFDRWGKLVHSANTRDRGWDGTDRSTGKPVPQGLYVYKVTVTDNKGATHQRISQVTVLR